MLSINRNESDKTIWLIIRKTKMCSCGHKKVDVDLEQW